jgi:hypothetical protein
LQNISGTNAATWLQKLATDFPSLLENIAIFNQLKVAKHIWHASFYLVSEAGT